MQRSKAFARTPSTTSVSSPSTENFDACAPSGRRERTRRVSASPYARGSTARMHIQMASACARFCRIGTAVVVSSRRNESRLRLACVASAVELAAELAADRSLCDTMRRLRERHSLRRRNECSFRRARSEFDVWIRRRRSDRLRRIGKVERRDSSDDRKYARIFCIENHQNSPNRNLSSSERLLQDE